MPRWSGRARCARAGDADMEAGPHTAGPWPAAKARAVPSAAAPPAPRGDATLPTAARASDVTTPVHGGIHPAHTRRHHRAGLGLRPRSPSSEAASAPRRGRERPVGRAATGRPAPARRSGGLGGGRRGPSGRSRRGCRESPPRSPGSRPDRCLRRRRWRVQVDPEDVGQRVEEGQPGAERAGRAGPRRDPQGLAPTQATRVATPPIAGPASHHATARRRSPRTSSVPPGRPLSRRPGCRAPCTRGGGARRRAAPRSGRPGPAGRSPGRSRGAPGRATAGWPAR